MPIPTVTPTELSKLLQQSDPPVLLDVRLSHERAWVKLPGELHIPLHELAERKDELEGLTAKTVIVYCHHGVRSLDGAAFLQSLGIDARSLSGGIDRYSLEIDPTLPRY